MIKILTENDSVMRFKLLTLHSECFALDTIHYIKYHRSFLHNRYHFSNQIR